MKNFELHRDNDETGVSGTGIVAEGVEFPGGLVVMKWRGDLSSVGIYKSIFELEQIHGHNGATRIVWLEC